MGFTTGFTGGVTLTLSIAYLSVLAHQRNRQRQGEVLRANAYVLNTLSAAPDTPVRPPPPTRAELAALQRASFVETAKDRWNAEVESAVRWAQTTDWDGVRQSVEDGAASLWTQMFGATEGGKTIRDAAEATKATVAEAKSAAVSTARRAAEAAKTTASRVTTDAENKSAAAKGVFQKGVEKGKGAVDKAKAKAELAGESLESKIDRAMASLSDVDKALQQRYERKHDIMTKSINEVLDERYRSIGQRDNTVLRGL